MSYPLGSSLIPRIRVRRERWPGGYDIQCIPLVQVGQHVTPDQPVMRLARSAPSGALPRVPRLSLPDGVAPGTSNLYKSYTQRETLIAGLGGTIVGLTPRGSVLIEGETAILAGALGAGRQVAGPLKLWQARNPQEQKPTLPPGTILAIPGPLNLEMLHEALSAHLAGVVASSISSRDFENFLHRDLIELLRYANPDLLLPDLPSLTILLTEGLGTIAMPIRTINLLSQHQGKIVLLSGLTSLTTRIYPELLMSLARAETRDNPLALKPATGLLPGALVRVCSGSYEGAIGEIDYLFSHTQRFPSGILARAARLRLEDGSQLVVPLAILERIG